MIEPYDTNGYQMESSTTESTKLECRKSDCDQPIRCLLPKVVMIPTFSDIKCLSKSEFGNKIPTLSELIIILPKIQQIYSSRLAGDLPQKSKIGESKLDTECCWYKAFP